MKVKKALKSHKCDYCQKTIQKGERYSFERVYHSEDGKLYTWDHRFCQKCTDNSAKRLYKSSAHILRANKRAENCPDADFKYVWQGGWDKTLGCADGGDVKLECHKCNLHCVKS